MTKLVRVAVVVLIVGLAALPALCAPPRAAGVAPKATARPAAPARVEQAPPEGGFGRRSEMSEAERAKVREQMMGRMLDQAGLSDKEKAAAKKALKAKDQARQTLRAELANLRRIANRQKPSDTDLRPALATYRAAVKRYRKQVEAADQALVKQLSLEGEARCVSVGILDNGLGGMGRMGMRGEMGGPGGPGGPGRQQPSTPGKPK
jgi:hypothetical protein